MKMLKITMFQQRRVEFIFGMEILKVLRAIYAAFNCNQMSSKF